MELNGKNKKILYIVVAILSVLLVILGTFKATNNYSDEKDNKEVQKSKKE